MRTLYILLITLLSYTCYAQDGYKTNTKTAFGIMINLDDTQKEYVTVEIQLKADFHDNKLTNITAVAYRYQDGTIWENAKPLFKGKDWVTINQKALPITYIYETMSSKDEVPNDIIKVFKSAQEYFKLCIMPSSNSNFIIFL